MDNYFRLDKKTVKKNPVRKKRSIPVTTYFKVIGYDTFVKKYSVAVYINRLYYTTKLMNKEEIKAFNVKVSSTIKGF